MGLTSYVFALLAISNISLPSAQSTNGACVTSCFTTNPKSSFCNGDETGTALDQCRCASFSGPNDPLITCIKACPTDQQLTYAENLPSLCNSYLFPNLDLSSPSSSSSSAAQTATSSAAGSAGTSASTTASAAASATSATAGNGESRIGVNGREILAIVAGVAVLNFV